MTEAGALILLIDDNEDLREATREILESLGYEVLTVTSPDGVEEVSSDLLADTDLLVVHAYMSGEWGLAALDQLRSVNPEVPAIVLSGFGEDEAVRKQTAAGKFGFLVVPYAFDELAGMVQDALAGRVGFAPVL